MNKTGVMNIYGKRQTFTLCYRSKTSNVGNSSVHLCSCMYLYQRRDRDDVLDFKQAIDTDNSVSQ
jgi:hypothetical protein